jgi:alkanesulfonate monooxygenase SsuD/methylene tetrahydromethanopterin reductase-like flavin-dependent oxidoreductase (luciferase family)
VTRAAGRVGDGAILLRPITAAQTREGIHMVREEARRVGKDPDRVGIKVWVQSAVGSSAAQARRHAQGLVAEVLQMCHIDMFAEEDRDAILAIKRDYDFYEQNHLYGADRAPIPEKFVDMFAFAGDAETVRSQVRELMTVDGLDEIIVAPQNQEGSPGPSVEEVIRVFAEGVMHRL